MSLLGRNLLRASDLSKAEILSLIKLAGAIKEGRVKKDLRGKILASCFFEASTRTRLSFEAAMLRLGGQVLGFSDGNHTSSKKGESLSDTAKVISAYADVLVFRHPVKGSIDEFVLGASSLVINGGDGDNEHPTQMLTDVFSIYEVFGRLDDLTLGVVGDFRYSRTVHSLLYALSLFSSCRVIIVSPEVLRPSEEEGNFWEDKGLKVSFAETVEEIVEFTDILYVTRKQEERHFGVVSLYPKVEKSVLKKARKFLKVFHPLPRVDELSEDVDSSGYAYYFEQASNGVPVRQALLLSMFEGIESDY